MLKKTVDVCANCGKLSHEGREDFVCAACGANVCVVLPIAMFRQMVKAGLAKE